MRAEGPKARRSRFAVGDIVARGGTGREHRQLGEIVAVLGRGERERYLVHWETGRESIFYPAGAGGLHVRRRGAPIET